MDLAGAGETGVMSTGSRLLVLWVPDWPVVAHAKAAAHPELTSRSCCSRRARCSPALLPLGPRGCGGACDSARRRHDAPGSNAALRPSARCARLRTGAVRARAVAARPASGPARNRRRARPRSGTLLRRGAGSRPHRARHRRRPRGRARPRGHRRWAVRGGTGSALGSERRRHHRPARRPGRVPRDRCRSPCSKTPS